MCKGELVCMSECVSVCKELPSETPSLWICLSLLPVVGITSACHHDRFRNTGFGPFHLDPCVTKALDLKGENLTHLHKDMIENI